MAKQSKAFIPYYVPFFALKVNCCQFYFVCMSLSHYLKVKDGNVLGDLASGASNLAGKVKDFYFNVC